MALIKCRECGKDVSDQARTCPSCGIMLKSAVAVPIKTSIGTIIVAVILVLFAIGYIYGLIIAPVR